MTSSVLDFTHQAKDGIYKLYEMSDEHLLRLLLLKTRRITSRMQQESSNLSSIHKGLYSQYSEEDLREDIETFLDVATPVFAECFFRHLFSLSERGVTLSEGKAELPIREVLEKELAAEMVALLGRTSFLPRKGVNPAILLADNNRLGQISYEEDEMPF